jgi:hypothetical protein
MRTLLLAAAAALMFAGAADAKSCRDANGKYIKCPAEAPAAASAPAVTASKPASSSSMTSHSAQATGGAPHCAKGKPCGHSCIAMDKVCHH